MNTNPKGKKIKKIQKKNYITGKINQNLLKHSL